MHLRELFILTLVTLSQTCLGSSSTEHFDEHLTIRPLRDGRVATRFAFTMSMKNASPRRPHAFSDDDTPQHYTLFPLSLGQVLREYAVTEAHLSLNAGKWDYKNWGYPEDAAVATGAELWAWMGDSTMTSVDERWKGFRNALAGIFCASIGSLDDLRTTSPAYSFRPEGSLPKYNETHKLRHASLPSENVCTENLTPFLKLLPCKSSSGIASLLNPHRLFDADWHGMGIHVQWDPIEGVTVRLSFQAVFNPVRLSTLQKRDFSLRTLFDRSISKPCPIARKSVIEVFLPKVGAYSITPEPSQLFSGVATFDVTEVRDTPLDISIRWPEEAAFSYSLEHSTSPLTDFEVVRTLTGSTQSRGQLTVSIRNNRAHELQLVYLETMPWLVQFTLHTLELTTNSMQRDDLLSRISYIPPEAHGRPTLFEALLTVPPASTLHLKMDVIKSFLRYTEHQPDAQRGWDLPAAVLLPIAASHSSSSKSNDGSSDTALNARERDGQGQGRGQARLQRIYTPAVLVDLATPDFSMPYNVIIMSSTLIALIFGSIFNLLTRKFVYVRIVD